MGKRTFQGCDAEFNPRDHILVKVVLHFRRHQRDREAGRCDTVNCQYYGFDDCYINSLEFFYDEPFAL